MSVTITPSINLTAVETRSFDAASNSTIIHSGFNVAGPKLSATTTPPVSVVSYQTYALVAGAKTIDLRALLDSVDAAIDCNGLKVQTVIIVNPNGNSALNVAPGASNPYPLLGAGNDFTLPAATAGDVVAAFVLPEGTPDVSGTVKTIDFTGTGTQTFKVGLVLG